MKPLILFSVLLIFVDSLAAATVTTEANRMAEVSFQSAKAYAEQFNEVALDAVFTTPD